MSGAGWRNPTSAAGLAMAIAGVRVTAPPPPLRSLIFTASAPSRSQIRRRFTAFYRPPGNRSGSSTSRPSRFANAIPGRHDDSGKNRRATTCQPFAWQKSGSVLGFSACRCPLRPFARQTRRLLWRNRSDRKSTPSSARAWKRSRCSPRKARSRPADTNSQSTRPTARPPAPLGQSTWPPASRWVTQASAGRRSSAAACATPISPTTSSTSRSRATPRNTRRSRPLSAWVRESISLRNSASLPSMGLIYGYTQNNFHALNPLGDEFEQAQRHGLVDWHVQTMTITPSIELRYLVKPDPWELTLFLESTYAYFGHLADRAVIDEAAAQLSEQFRLLGERRRRGLSHAIPLVRLPGARRRPLRRHRLVRRPPPVRRPPATSTRSAAESPSTPAAKSPSSTASASASPTSGARGSVGIRWDRTRRMRLQPPMPEESVHRPTLRERR